ncbi:hypothetical protein NL676_018095 [Syzygium grande]|nr:hypothetical protein NL676_018095 [Syzygium grande]
MSIANRDGRHLLTPPPPSAYNPSADPPRPAVASVYIGAACRSSFFVAIPSSPGLPSPSFVAAITIATAAPLNSQRPLSPVLPLFPPAVQSEALLPASSRPSFVVVACATQPPHLAVAVPRSPLRPRASRPTWPGSTNVSPALRASPRPSLRLRSRPSTPALCPARPFASPSTLPDPTRLKLLREVRRGPPGCYCDVLSLPRSSPPPTSPPPNKRPKAIAAPPAIVALVSGRQPHLRCQAAASHPRPEAVVVPPV